MPKDGEKKKWTLAKIATIVGIVGSVLGILGTSISAYNGIMKAKSDIVASVGLNRTILIDDLEIRRDQKKRQLELAEEKLKLMKQTDPNYIDVRDTIFSLKDTIDDLNRLINKARNENNE